MIAQIQLPISVLGFIPPIIGCDGTFNTIRLGKTWAGRLLVSEQVLLMDEKAKQGFGMARVLSVEAGQLRELCRLYGSMNHTQLGVRGKRAAGSFLVIGG